MNENVVKQNLFINFEPSEGVVWRCSAEKVFLEISQNSQQSTCARVSFFNKVAGLRRATLLKKRLWHRCFPVNSAKFLRTPSLTEHLRWLLLNLTLRSQTLANIIEIFQNTHHVDLYLRTLHLPCFAAEAYSEPLQTSKMEFFCVSSSRL